MWIWSSLFFPMASYGYWGMGFQDPATPIMAQAVSFHNNLMVVLSGVGAIVLLLIVYIIWRYRQKKNPIPSTQSHNPWLEVIWTLVPIVILTYIAPASFSLIRAMDTPIEGALTIKVVGHQWYWHYEYPDESIAFDSYMVQDADLAERQHRLLSVDMPLVIPAHTNIRLVGTSADVIHSWAIPAFGIKRDTVPGRLSEVVFSVTREGTYFGQCSELCGPHHGFMPIEVRVVSQKDFKHWLKKVRRTHGV